MAAHPPIVASRGKARRERRSTALAVYGIVGGAVN
jgi:hypothetical protein